MSIWKFLGLGEAPPEREEGDTATVRRISAELERLDPERARFLAAFAYVLARVAHADLHICEAETEEMVRIVEGMASLSPGEAALAVEIAKSQARLLGGTENYVVTREFRRISTPEQRVELLQCLFAVAGADDRISGAESLEIQAIAGELGLSRADVNALRAAHRDKLSEFQR